MKKPFILFMSFLFVITFVLPFSRIGINDVSAADTPTVLFQQPSINTEADFLRYLTRQDAFALQWPDAYGAGTPVSYDLGVFTGFQIPSEVRSQFQRAPNANYGTTAFQGYQGTVGIWMNTSSAPMPGSLLPMTPVYNWPMDKWVSPFTDPQKELSFSFEMKVPVMEKVGDVPIYGNAHFLFVNKNDWKIQFWYGGQIFDNRGLQPEQILHDVWEGGTNLAIVFSAIADGMKYAHRGPNSSTFIKGSWPDFNYFDYRISRSEFEAALNAVKNDSRFPNFANSNVNDFVLTHINLNPEIAIFNSSYQGKLGVAIRNIKVALAAPGNGDSTSPSSYTKVMVRAANGTPVPQKLQIFFTTEASNFYSEDKSMKVDLPAGGGYWDLVADFRGNTQYKGKITGLRVDPISGDGFFAIDYVYVSNANGEFTKQWDFSGTKTLTNPFFGWTLNNIADGWTDGQGWGGRGINGDPMFAIDANFSVDAAPVPPPTPVLPTVTVTALNSTAPESGATSGTFRISRTGSTNSSLPIYVTMSGTATSGTDYRAITSPATIAAGASYVDLALTPIQDFLYEGNETAILTLSANGAYTLGSPNSATVTILDDDSAKPVYDKVYIKAANGTGVARTLQVFFQTETSRSYSESKSAKVTLPAGGGYVEVVVDLSTAKDPITQKPTYVGKIVALRVDPIDSNGGFGIDCIYVGTANRQYIQKWDFNGQSQFTNPFFGWRIGNITGAKTDGAVWYGSGINGDPQFGADVNFDSGR